MAKRTDRDDTEDVEQEREPAAVTAAAVELYATDRDRFMDVRGELAARARADGDAEAAKLIGKLRKPTVAAWIVNRQVHENGEVVEQLLELNRRLRAAHEDLDAEQLRTLSTERRELVGRVTRDALAAAGRSDAPTQLQDEVLSTFDAAVADPSIARRLGRLQKSESWSGFGLAPVASPELTVVQGGRTTRATRQDKGRQELRKPEKSPTSQSKASSATASAAATRALTKARKVRDEAESDVAAAEAEELSRREHVTSLSNELSRLQAELDKANVELDAARRAVKSARARHREAQAAVNRAERAADK